MRRAVRRVSPRRRRAAAGMVAAGAGGFTLIEIMVVVTIISVLAMLCVPAVQRLQRRAKSTTIVNDFRVFATAIDTYAHETGNWPAETKAGVCPVVLQSRVNTTAWLRPTPMGGQYNWDYQQKQFGTKITAAISIGATKSAPLPLDVDQLIDLEHVIDGANYNLLGGTFRLGNGLVPVYVIEP